MTGSQAANIGLVLDPEALYTALDAHRRALQREHGGKLSWRKVANQIGISPSTFSRIGIKCGNVHANALIKLLAWMGESDIKPYTRHVSAPMETLGAGHWEAT